MLPCSRELYFQLEALFSTPEFERLAAATVFSFRSPWMSLSQSSKDGSVFFHTLDFSIFKNGHIPDPEPLEWHQRTEIRTEIYGPPRLVRESYEN